VTRYGTAARAAVLFAAWGTVLPGLIAPAEAQTIGYTASLYGVHGTYPTERMNSVYVFNGIDVSAGPFRVAVTLPFVRTETTPVTTDGTTPAAASTNSGIGDPLLRLDVRLLHDPARGLQLGLAGAVKVPFVDATTGRGTGEADYGVGASAFSTLHRTSFMADVLFWKYGDPDDVDFTNTWSYSVGVAQVLGTGRVSAIGSISGFSSGISDQPPPVSLNVGVLSLVGRRQSLAVSASVGLNDSTSDFSIGASWRIAR